MTLTSTIPEETAHIYFNIKDININGVPYKILLKDNEHQFKSCPLLAILNLLLLSTAHRSSVTPLLQLIYNSNSNKIQLKQLLLCVNDLAIKAQSTEALNVIPTLYNTTLNINPIFNGSFQESTELSIFRNFGIGLVHGWIISPNQDPLAYDIVSKYSYESSKSLLQQAYEISNSGVQSYQTNQVLDTATYVKSFLARSANQLTEYGLQYLQAILLENSYAILYRNEVFQLLFKNNNQLFLLVDDDINPDIIWRSLKSVNGRDDTFFTGDFIPSPTEYLPNNNKINNTNNNNNVNAINMESFNNNTRFGGAAAPDSFSPPDTTVNDEALARALQEEENRAREIIMRARINNANGNPNNNNNNSNNSNNMYGANNNNTGDNNDSRGGSSSPYVFRDADGNEIDTDDGLKRRISLKTRMSGVGKKGKKTCILM